MDVDATNKLKLKIIKDFNNYIKRLNKGYKEDYNNILNEISLIETYSDLDNLKLLYEYYINYGV